jgi:RHS repeat-associated protein
VYGSRTNVPDYVIASSDTYRIVADHLGNVRLVVDISTGLVAQRIEYDAFGPVSQNTSPGLQPFGFAGGLLDDATGLVRFGARDYDSHIGRWITKDPVGFVGGLNLYVYATNDPVNFVDVNGTDPQPWWRTIARVALEWLGQAVVDPMYLARDAVRFLFCPSWSTLTNLAFSAIAVGTPMPRGGRLGDLTLDEIRRIQQVVDKAGRPLEVVGSAARAERRGVGTKRPIGKGPGTRSDIDYLVPPGSLDYFKGLDGQLPSFNGLIPGMHNPFIGPGIRFEPHTAPVFRPGAR